MAYCAPRVWPSNNMKKIFEYLVLLNNLADNKTIKALSGFYCLVIFAPITRWERHDQPVCLGVFVRIPLDCGGTEFCWTIC